MPSRAIPLVTISYARGHLPQTRLADNLERVAGRPYSTDEDHPPPYDTASQSSRGSGDSDIEVATVSPSNEDITQAVLHLSRTLPKASPHPVSSLMYMVFYGWTQTQRTALRVYHNILSKPGALLRSIRGQDEQALVQQRRKQHKGIQQLMDEEDRLENDLGVLNNATEMVPVSLMNTQHVATMEKSLPEDPEEPDINGLSSDDDSTGLRKPSRQIDQYGNPFGPGVSSDDEQEDDEGWFGHEEEQTENESTKTNSVRLLSRKLSRSYGRRMPDFITPSLSPPMGPRQFESGNPGSSSSISSTLSRPTGANFGQPLTRLSRSRFPSTSSISNNATCSVRQDLQVEKELKAHIIETRSELHSRSRSSQIESSWSDKSSLGESLVSQSVPPTRLISSASSFISIEDAVSS